MKRRRNKVVLWEWSRDGEHTDLRRERGGKQRSIGAQAAGAAALIAFLVFFLSKIPDTTPGYDRDDLARFMCGTFAVNPESAQCAVVAIGSWFLVMVAAGILLRMGRAALRRVGWGRAGRD